MTVERGSGLALAVGPGIGIGIGIEIEIGIGNGTRTYRARVAFAVNHWLAHQRVKHSTANENIFQFHATFAAEVLMSVEIAGPYAAKEKPRLHPSLQISPIRES